MQIDPRASIYENGDISDVHAIHKPSWFRTITGKGKWYLLSSAMTKGLSILLLPIYTRYLSPSEYGVLNTLASIAQLLPIFISLYLDAAFGRFYHSMKVDPLQLRRLFSTVYWFVLLNGTVVLTLSLSTLPFWALKLLRVPSTLYFLALVPTVFLQVAQLGLVFLRQSLEAPRTTFLEVSSAILVAAITLPLLIGAHLGVMARLMGSAGSALYLFIFYTAFLLKKGILAFQFDPKTLRKCLAFSLPLVPNIAGGWIAGLSDRLVLTAYVDTTATGIYSLAINLAALLYVLQDAITQVSSPISVSGLVHDREATKRKMSVLSLTLWAVMLMADAGLVLFGREIIAIFATHKYADAAGLVGFLGLTYVFASQYRVFSDVLTYHQKTWVISTAAIIMAAMGLGMNLVLVPRYGYLASVGAIVSSTIAYTVWIFVWSQRIDPVKIHTFRMLAVLTVFGAMVVVGMYLKSTNVSTILEKILLYGIGIALSFVIIKSKVMPKRRTLNGKS
jgi:O-antigen/teichoic acid export membrane protein